MEKKLALKRYFMKIILCGLPKSGKTTIGQLAAEFLSYPFIDTDRAIIQHYHQQTGQRLTCREIVIKEGIEIFRQLEQKAIQKIGPGKCVVALGGGALESDENQKLLTSIGFMIYLQTDPDLVFTRILNDGCPPYLDQSNPYKSYLELVERRIPIYKKLCNMMLNISKMTPRQAALEMVQQLQVSQEKA
jgi:shikimate kinase